jgi:transcriptional regulator with XRE-family HTH domain
MTEIGNRIKEIRLKKGLSQEELAEASKVNLRTIQRIENNETKPREKTLQLIFNALEIEIIEREKKVIDKYLIWTIFLTSLIIICSFMAWIYKFKFFKNGERIYRKVTGWNGHINLNDYDYQNWMLSLSAITIGLVVLSHSLNLIKYKMKYIIIQIFCVLLYLIALLDGEQGDLRPALFIVLIAIVLLIITYRKKGRKTGANTV